MKKKPLSLIIALIAALSLTACGSSSSESASGAMYKSAATDSMALTEEAAYDNGFVMEDAEYDSAAGAESPEVGESGAQSNRKLITRMDISAETEALDPLVKAIEDKAVSLGGYIENSSVYNTTTYYGAEEARREAYITARVPAKRLDEFVSMLEGSSNITSRSRNVEDVTLNYVDTQAHKEALEAEQQSLMKLMDNAKSIEDIMAIETRLTDVRYQLESIERQLRSYDNQIDYSTASIQLIEVRSYTPQEDSSFGSRISKGLKESLYDVGDGIVDFIVFVITHLPQIIIFIIVIVILIIIVRAVILLIKKRSSKRKEKRGRKTNDMKQNNVPNEPEGEKNEVQGNSENKSKYTAYEANPDENKDK